MSEKKTVRARKAPELLEPIAAPAAAEKTKAKVTKGSSHSYPSMVKAAISSLAERGGSSYQAIEKYIGETHSDKPVDHKFVMRALKKLTAEGQIAQDGHHYKLTASAKASLKRSGSRKRSTSPKKAKKDPNAPKRPLSAYMFYSMEHRAAVKKANPAATFGQLGQLLAVDWKKVTEAGKKKYVAEAEKDKKRYEKEKAAYVPPEGSAAAKKAAKKKRAPSAYNLFIKEEVPKIREANPGIDHKEAFKRAAAEWKKHGKKPAAKKTAAAKPAPPAAEAKPTAPKKTSTAKKTSATKTKKPAVASKAARK